MLLYFLICFVSFTSSLNGQKLHEHMSKEEIRSVFNVEPEKVHEIDYEVVTVYHDDEPINEPRKQESAVAYIITSDVQYTFYLEKNDNVLLGSNTKLLEVYNNTEGKIDYAVKQYPNEFELYHDETNEAAFAVHIDKNGKINIDGTIGEELTIRSVSDKVNELKYKLPNMFPNHTLPEDHPALRTRRSPAHHIFIRQSNKKHTRLRRKASYIKNPIVPDLSNAVYRLTGRFCIPSSRAPSIIYPELLIYIDLETYKTYGENFFKYVAAFWNSVDLIFRKTNLPRVRLNIAGVIIPKTSTVDLYLTEALKYNGSDLNVEKVLRTTKKYIANFEKIFPTNSFDIVVGMTKKNLRSDGDGPSNKILGTATMGTACIMNDEYNFSNAIIQDHGNFRAIITAAHEIAHVLGAGHDDLELFSKLNLPCHWDKYYIMDSIDVRHVPDVQKIWSQCSQYIMNSFVKCHFSRCLWNKPDVGIPYNKILPKNYSSLGNLITVPSRDEQCKSLVRKNEGVISDKEGESDCSLLRCKLPSGSMFLSDHPPVERTSCGEGLICLDGQCVKDRKLYYIQPQAPNSDES